MVPKLAFTPFWQDSELTFSNNLFSPTLKANNGKLQYSNYYLTTEQLESHIQYGISGLMYLSSEFYDPEFRGESFRSYIQA